MKGKNAKAYRLEFSEAVLWGRNKVGGALANLSSRWEIGIFLGMQGKTREFSSSAYATPRASGHPGQ